MNLGLYRIEQHQPPPHDQRAMAVAMVYPSGQWQKAVKNAAFSTSYVKHARTILKYLPAQAESVLSGAAPLNQAYEDAKESGQSAKPDR